MRHLPRSNKHALALAALALFSAPGLAQTQVWFQETDSITYDGATAVAVDGAGGVFAGGITGMDFFGPRDAWISRVDADGQPLWRAQFGTTVGDSLAVLVADGNQGVFASGHTDGDIAGTGNGGIDDFWLARYDGVGNRAWIRQFGGAGWDVAIGGASDEAGGVYLCGRTQGSLGAPNAGEEDAWLGRFDGQGQQLWTIQLGSSGIDIAKAVTPDGQGGVYVTGSTNRSLGGPALGNFDGWLARVDASGSILWTRQIGTSTADTADVVVPDGSGGVFVGGQTAGALSGPNMGFLDVWIARYDAAGAEIWTTQLGSFGEENVFSGALDQTGGFYLVGRSTGDFGAGGLNGGPSWIAHFDSGGAPYWIEQYGVTGSQSAAAAVSNGVGGLFLAGSLAPPVSVPSKGPNAWVMRFDDIEAESFCSSAVPNSSGAIASLSATGSSVVAANEVILTASGLPPAAVGYLIVSLAQSTPTVPPGSQGSLCLGGSIGRYVGPGQVQTADAAGSFTLPIDLTAMPQPTGIVQAMSGESWAFQAWHRDANPSTTSNFSSGLEVMLR